MKVARFAIQMVLGIVLPLAVQLWDRRRLTAEQRARAWNGATWGSALYAFSVLSMLGWFWVTRRGVRRFVYGPVSTVVLAVLLGLADAAIAQALGLAP